MTPGEWQQVSALFEAALKLPAAARAHHVQEHAPVPAIADEVRSLLAAHERDGAFLDDALAIEGQTIGSYRILRRAGQGGMGVVFEAEDTQLHRRVAIKMLPAGAAGDARGRQRLRHEARAAAALAHPGIATVFALEEVDHHLFIVSEFLDGETLRAELQRGPLPPALALATALAIARALKAAHERGVVHRDLKPENIVRTHTGQVKVLDFGVAQFERTADSPALPTRSTMSDLVVGTPAYMAPEQLLGRPTDARTDQFAFGVLLYELIEGRAPFGGVSLPSTIARVMAGEVTAPAASGVMPDAVWHVVQRCLQVDPQRRFATTTELVAAVAAAAAVPAVTSADHRRGAPLQPTPPEGSVPAGASLHWWRFHQSAAFVAYWAIVWPAWHVHRWMGGAGLWFFIAIVVAVIVGANLRLHLWFSCRVYPTELPRQRAVLGPWIRGADAVLASLLVAGGLAISAAHTGWAALLVGYGIGAAVMFLVVETATAKAAFND